MSSRALGAVVAAIVAAAIRVPIVTAAVVLVGAGASLYLAVSTDRLGIDTNTANMISPRLDWRQDFDEYRNSFPARDRNIVAVIDGPSSEASMRHARALAAALRSEPDLFPSVFLEGDGEFFERNGLLYLPLDELEDLYDRLYDVQPLLGRLARDVSGAGVLDVLADSYELADGADASALQGRDEIFAEIAATLLASIARERRPVLWGQLLGVAADDSTRKLLLIQPVLDFTGRAPPARDAIERIRAIDTGLTRDLAVGAELRLTGAVVMEHEELSSVVASARAAGIASLVLVLIVLLITLRSWRLLIVSLLTLFAGLAVTAAFAGFAVGRLNLLSVAFAVLYVGLGVDFILHLLLRHRELQRSGFGRDRALLETAQGVGGSLVICAATTLVCFLAFMPTDFVGISELGLISGVGMVISLFVSLTLLPALLRLVWPETLAHSVGAAQRRLIRWPQLPPRVTCVAAISIAILACVFLPSLEFDGNPIRLRDPDSESIRTLEDLSSDSTAPLFDLVVLVPDAEAAAARALSLTELPTVKQVRTAASLVPDGQDDKLLLLEDLGFYMGSTIRGFEPDDPSANRVGLALERLNERVAMISTPTPSERELTIAADRWLDWNASLPLTEAASVGAVVDADILGNLAEQVQRLERSLDARRFSFDDLPAVLRDRWVNAAGQRLVEVVPSEDLNDSAAAARFVAEVHSVAPRATGLPVVYEQAAATVTRAFSLALLYAFLAVTLLLLVLMRSIRDTLLVLGPILFAALVTAASSVILGIPLNFANIIALPLLVGVGVDSGIHIVHRVRTEPPAGVGLLHTSTSKAVFASAVTTVASFGNLAFSSHRGMASMGQLLTLGMAMSLVAMLIVLPALLRLGRPT
jgi:hopanoid biosynthesis associated RND transporter like protein HpnN